jgi:cysteine sulfinate desulfinase/cysteine desulfurase-like protein
MLNYNITSASEALNTISLLSGVMLLRKLNGYNQPIEEISKVCQKHNVLFHTDASQSS